MHNFKRGTVLKLTCDVYEFLAKAPKAYEDLIDIISDDGTVKVKTHNGDYVGFYGMKVKIHTRFMKQFVDVTPDKIEVPVIELDKQDPDTVAWKTYDSCEADENGERIILKKVTTNKEAAEFNSTAELDKQLETLNPELAQERIACFVKGKFKKGDEYDSTAEFDKQLETLNPGVLTSEPIDYMTIIGRSLLEETTESLATAASKLNSLGYEIKGDEWLNKEEIKKNKAIEMRNKICGMPLIDIAQLLIDNNIEL